MKKKIITIVVLVIFLISILQIVKTYYISNFGLLISYEIPDEITVFEGENEVPFTNKELISRLYKQMRFKGLKRVNHDTSLESWNNRIMLIEVDANGERLFIDKYGKISISIEKGDIRNKSWFHWLWWKFDNVFYNNNYIYYLSDSDNKVVDTINEIKIDIKK